MNEEMAKLAESADSRLVFLGQVLKLEFVCVQLLNKHII
jgi:hypothetical protein